MAGAIVSAAGFASPEVTQALKPNWERKLQCNGGGGADIAGSKYTISVIN